MKRRQLLRAAAAVPLLGAARAGFASEAHTPYSREAYEAALASGKPFMLDFYATW